HLHTFPTRRSSDLIVATRDAFHGAMRMVPSAIDDRRSQITLYEGSFNQEIRGRNLNARSRAEAGTAQGDQAGPRARRSAGERRVRRGQRAAASGRGPDFDAQEAGG